MEASSRYESGAAGAERAGTTSAAPTPESRSSSFRWREWTHRCRGRWNARSASSTLLSIAPEDGRGRGQRQPGLQRQRAAGDGAGVRRRARPVRPRQHRPRVRRRPRPYGAVAGRQRAGQRLRRLQGDGGNSGRTARTPSSFARRPWTAGASGKGGNFVETIAGKEKGALRVVDDQTMSPTATASRVVLRILASGGAPYHAVNDGAATWSPAKSSASPEPS